MMDNETMQMKGQGQAWNKVGIDGDLRRAWSSAARRWTTAQAVAAHQPWHGVSSDDQPADYWGNMDEATRYGITAIVTQDWLVLFDCLCCLLPFQIPLFAFTDYARSGSKYLYMGIIKSKLVSPVCLNPVAVS
jgi:hypothetical protein